MNRDLAFDDSDAAREFAFVPRVFALNREDLGGMKAVVRRSWSSSFPSEDSPRFAEQQLALARQPTPVVGRLGR